MVMWAIAFFIAGTVFGAVLVFISTAMERRKSQGELERRQAELEKISKAAFYEIASQSTDQILKVAKEIFDSKATENAADLDGKKQLIDQSLSSMAKDLQERMDRVHKLMTDINQSVPEKYGQVTSAINHIAAQSENLRQTTEALKIALSSAQKRGQWGERMAEDILRMVGLVEGINYTKQKTIEGGRSRPDFTFLLPDNLKVHMDVKFPLNKYLEYLECDGVQRENAQKMFLGAVRARIKEVTSRDYINPDDNTIDYVLVFIPNEQVYTFIHECDSKLLDEALAQKVVLCSPLTLYAMLALIRQAFDNFNLRKSSNEILTLLAGFTSQWRKFVGSMDSLGKRLDLARSDYDFMVGTRKKLMDVQVKRIDALSKAGGIEPKILDSGDGDAELELRREVDDNLLPLK